MAKSENDTQMGKKNCWKLLDSLVEKGIVPRLAHRILLWGPKGTGKSFWAYSKFGREKVESATCHKAMYPEDLLGSYQLKDGSTIWNDGPMIRAYRKSHTDTAVLVLDELDQHSPELRCCLQGGMNDRDIANVTLPTGETVRPGDGLLIVGTSNANPGSLWEPLLDRFDLVLLANTPAPGMLDSLPKPMAKFLGNHTEREYAEAHWVPGPSPRNILRLARYQGELEGGLEEAAEIVFGSNARDILEALAVAGD